MNNLAFTAMVFLLIICVLSALELIYNVVNKRISVTKFMVNLCKDCYYRNKLILFAEKFAIVFS